MVDSFWHFQLERIVLPLREGIYRIRSHNVRDLLLTAGLPIKAYTGTQLDALLTLGTTVVQQGESFPISDTQPLRMTRHYITSGSCHAQTRKVYRVFGRSNFEREAPAYIPRPIAL